MRPRPRNISIPHARPAGRASRRNCRCNTTRWRKCWTKGVPWPLRGGPHTAGDLLAETLPDAAKRYCALAANGVGFATSAGLLWFGGIAAMQSRSLGTIIYKTVVLPEWWILALIPFCGALLVIEFGRKIRATLRGEPQQLAPRQG